MIKFDTARAFITSGTKSSGYTAGEIISFEGFENKGDGGAARWKAKGTIGTVSQDPITLNLAELSDASGNQFELVGEGVIDLFALGGITAGYVNIAVAAGLTYVQGLTSDVSNDVKSYDTMTNLKAAVASLSIGEVYYLNEREAGNGGGAHWEAIDATTSPGNAPNEIDIVTGDASISFKIILTSEVKTRQLGLGFDSADDSDGLNRLMTMLETDNLTVISDADEIFNTTTAAIDCKVGIKWNANDATLKPVGFNGLIVGADATGVSTTLFSDAQINTNNITVTSSTGFSTGDLVEMRSDAAWMLDPTPTENMKKGETFIIQSISGTDWQLESLLYDNYNLPGETVTLTKIGKIKPVIKGLNIDYATQEAKVGMEIRGAVDGLVENCTINKAQTQGLNIAQSYNTKVKYSNINGSNGSGTGYGVQFNASTKCDVLFSKFSECRRGVDLSGVIPSRACRIWYNEADGSGLDSLGADLPSNTGSSGFGSHETSEHNSFRFNKVSGCRYGILSRGKDEIVDDNEFYQDIVIACIQFSKSINWSACSNKYHASLRPGKTLDIVATDDDEQKTPFFISFTDPAIDGGYYTIKNNEFDDLKNAFIAATITVSAPFSSFSNMAITGNSGIMTGSTLQTTVKFIEAVDQAFTITDSAIIDNIITEDTTALTMYDTNITIDYADTVDIDNYPIPATDIINGGGGGTLTIDDSNLNLTVKNSVVTVTGFINFDVTVATTIVKLQNLPTKTIGAIGPSYGFPYIGTVETASVGNTGMIAMPGGVSGIIPNSAWISFDQLAYNTGFPIANNYHIPVCFQYATQRRLT